MRYISFANGTYLYMYPDGNVSVSPTLPCYSGGWLPDYTLSILLFVAMVLAVVLILHFKHP